MNKFSQRLAIAVMTCAAVSLTACKKEEKPEDKPAPAASTPAPTPPAATPAPTPPPAPAPEKKSEATPPPAAAPAMAPATPATPPAAPAPDKKSEAPSTAPTATGSTASATPAPTQVAQATPPAAAPAAPAQPEDIKDRTSPPDPVSEFAKAQGFKFEDGRYRNKDGEPQPIVTKDFMVDWGTWNGFRRYHDACHVCHGPNALGSTFAPALKDSLKVLDYGTFVATVSGGRVVNRAGTTYVMPSFGTDKNIMCYLDDIYSYIKSRSNYDSPDQKNGMPPGRPNGREDISPETRKAANDCTG